MTAILGPEELEVKADEPMPMGYVFVPKGNVYITKNCRKKTHEADKTLYVVFDAKNKLMGLRCPAYIYLAVMRENMATAAQRAEAVRKRDAAIEENFEDAMLKMFPHIPKPEIPQIIKHALKKHARRVGRANTVALHERVRLAVRAHIRHVHTDYEQLLRRGVDRAAARQRIWPRLNEIARLWGGRPLKPAPARPAQERQAMMRSKAASFAARKTGATGAAKKAVVQTGRVAGAGEALLLGDEDILMEGVSDAEVNGFMEDDIDYQDAVFDMAEDTSDSDSDGNNWSN